MEGSCQGFAAHSHGQGGSSRRQVDGETWDMAGSTTHLSEYLLSGLHGADLRSSQGRNEPEMGQFDARGGAWLGRVIDGERRHIANAELIDHAIMVAIDTVAH